MDRYCSGLFVFTALYIFLFSGAFHGWGPMQLMLEENGSYEDMCYGYDEYNNHKDSSTFGPEINNYYDKDKEDFDEYGKGKSRLCSRRTARLLTIPLVAQITIVFSPLLGELTDRLGPSALMIFLASAGCIGFILLLGSVASGVDHLLFVAFISLGFMSFSGGLMTVKTGLAYSDQKTQTRVISILNSLYDAGSITYLGLWTVSKVTSMSFVAIFGVYLVLAIVCYGGATVFWFFITRETARTAIIIITTTNKHPVTKPKYRKATSNIDSSSSPHEMMSPKHELRRNRNSTIFARSAGKDESFSSDILLGNQKTVVTSSTNNEPPFSVTTKVVDLEWNCNGESYHHESDNIRHHCEDYEDRQQQGTLDNSRGQQPSDSLFEYATTQMETELISTASISTHMFEADFRTELDAAVESMIGLVDALIDSIRTEHDDRLDSSEATIKNNEDGTIQEGADSGNKYEPRKSDNTRKLGTEETTTTTGRLQIVGDQDDDIICETTSLILDDDHDDLIAWETQKFMKSEQLRQNMEHTDDDDEIMEQITGRNISKGLDVEKISPVHVNVTQEDDSEKSTTTTTTTTGGGSVVPQHVDDDIAGETQTSIESKEDKEQQLHHSCMATTQDVIAAHAVADMNVDWQQQVYGILDDTDDNNVSNDDHDHDHSDSQLSFMKDIPLSEQSAKDQLLSSAFCMLIVFFSINLTINFWTLTTARDFLAYLGDDEFGNRYLTIFYLLMPASVMAVPLVDIAIHRYGFHCALQLIVLLKATHGIIQTTTLNLNVQILGFIFFSCYRCFLFSIVFSLLPIVLHSNVTGKASGILYFFGGMFAFVNIPLANIAITKLDGNFFLPNVLYMVLLIPCSILAYFIGRFIESENQIKARQEDRRYRHSLKFESEVFRISDSVSRFQI